MTHDPITCLECSPDPWAQTEVSLGARGRRFTGWVAVAVFVGPMFVAGFVLGVLLGMAIA